MGRAKEYTGTVLSSKMAKTIVVKVVRASKHPKYGRILKTSNKFKVHDEKNSAKMGDIVRIEETRPLSKEKRFKLVEIIKKAQAEGIELKE
ncbi:MAG: 30S ribosomal protein S17 [Candidatus Omnitrophica bacterium]|nr:30S ribosomal protein S17 [Candidatus Omnitrophota bacterium]